MRQRWQVYQSASAGASARTSVSEKRRASDGRLRSYQGDDRSPDDTFKNVKCNILFKPNTVVKVTGGWETLSASDLLSRHDVCWLRPTGLSWSDSGVATKPDFGGLGIQIPPPQAPSGRAEA